MPASSPAARLARILPVLGLVGADPVPLPSDSNDAWRIGESVLRICYRGDVGRLARDTLVAGAVPASLRAPRVLDCGEVDGLAWQLTAWVDGAPLAEVWRGLGAAERQRAVAQVGELLAELNGYVFSAAVRRSLGGRRPDGPITPSVVIGADLNPLPVDRARVLLEPAARLDGVDHGLIEAVADLFDELEPEDPLGEQALAEIGGGVVVHGDAHPSNVLWDDGVVALLDWEWVRLGSPELELEPFLRRGSWSHPPGVAETAQVLGWLAQGHPAAFAHPDLVSRLWLVELAYTLRHLLLWPPNAPEDQLPEDHPLRRLRRITSGSDHLRPLLAAVRDG